MLIPWVYFVKEGQQLLIESPTKRWTFNGPGRYFASPFQKVTYRQGITLGPTEYIRIHDTLTGELRNEIGPQLYFLSASEEVIERLKAIPLKRDQYVRLLDTSSGEIRVVRGECSVYLSPTEKQIGQVQRGVYIDQETSVVVLDTETGRLELITEQQVFFPNEHQEIKKIQRLTRLADHETMILKDDTGHYVFKTGAGGDRSFFIDPYSEVVTLHWSSGLYKDHRNLEISLIDSRPKFMWYEFEVRTQDNVELVLGLTFFWQIVDVPQMIRTTDDTTGDICSHARSAIIQAVSRSTLEDFLSSFNPIVRDAVLNEQDTFYEERGVILHAIEVRSITCKDTDTQMVLQEIIRETTNRLNRLQKQESINEIELKKLQGRIESETMRGQLLELQRQNRQLSARIDGESEATKIRVFLELLGEDVPLEDKIALFNTLRKREMLDGLSKGNVQLYFTPSDVDLSIESRSSRR